ncbi:type IV conjugative transfer system pilin TraA [Vibrio lentus]|nr:MULTISPECIES: type IV conjugative transfer system pilin TraA [Vibrio]CAH7260214.1 Pilin [Vibrio chagasii]NOI41066.1 type IV conjugative transfer system pilin TraA [Vibrio sp. 070316B]PMH26737.1 type IV conjugative transfer system pilin TraA [Vibrio lentus]CAH7293773.1 Pilin [Vibrio chagasii]CAH7454969.1 Pilin [Vibrio chagasii]
MQINSTYHASGRVLLLLCVAAVCVLAAEPAMAAATDLFASGKDMVKKNAGDDSGIETAMLGFSALSAAVVGITSRNWFGAVGGFAGGMMFWETVKPLVGLA